jgi:hypothetical protein
MATESSSVPKSVMKTMVGAYFLARWAAMGTVRAAHNNASKNATLINVGLLPSFKTRQAGMGKWLLPRDRAVAKSVLHHKVFVAFNIGSPRELRKKANRCARSGLPQAFQLRARPQF